MRLRIRWLANFVRRRQLSDELVQQAAVSGGVANRRFLGDTGYWRMWDAPPMYQT